MIFTDRKHAERFGAAVRAAGAVRDDDTIKADFGASLFILTGLPDVYERVEQHVRHGYIEFEQMLCMGLSTGESVLVSLAGNLYNDAFFDGYTPLDIVTYCDVEGVELAARALALRKQQLNINTIFDIV